MLLFIGCPLLPVVVADAGSPSESCGEQTWEIDYAELNGPTTDVGSLEKCLHAWHAVTDSDVCLYQPAAELTRPCPADGLRFCDTCGDADCVTLQIPGTEEPECVCLRQCRGDADCEGYGSCLCAQRAAGSSTSSRCVTGDCQSDNDCEPGERCMVPTADRTWTHHCTKPIDECEPELPCTNNAAPQCRYDDDQQRFRCFPYPDPID
jgi:hypothetical protein